VFRDMVGQVLPTQYLVAPLIEGHIKYLMGRPSASEYSAATPCIF
jgi:hypothetical protein